MIKEYEFEKTLNLKTFLSNSKSVICFSLDFEANVLFCNEGYNRTLGYVEKNIECNFINPVFDSLITDTKEGIVFSGIITLKKMRLNSSYVAKVYRSSHELFFLCEYDGLEVEDLFKEMSSNTLSINNMNRELIRKEIMLKNSISQLKEVQAMLIQSEKMNALGQLVAGVAHEINNPIAYVMSNIEVMGQYFCSIKEFFEDYAKGKIVNILNLKKKYDIDYILEDCSALQKSTLDGGDRIK